VIADRNAFLGKRAEIAQDKNRRIRINAEIDQQNQHRAFMQNLQLAPIQGALLGGVGVFGKVAKTAYNLYSMADTGLQLRDAAKSGKPTDIVGAVLPPIAGKLQHSIIGGVGSTPAEQAPRPKLVGSTNQAPAPAPQAMPKPDQRAVRQALQTPRIAPPADLQPGVRTPPKALLPSADAPAKPVGRMEQAEQRSTPVNRPRDKTTGQKNAKEYTRGRKLTLKEAREGPRTLSEDAEALADVFTPQEKLTTRRKGEKPLTERSVIALAGAAMEKQGIKMAKQKMEGPDVKVIPNKKFPPDLKRAFAKEGVKGPDALVADKKKNNLSPLDVTARSTKEHEAKSKRDQAILNKHLPERFKDEGVGVGRPIEILTDSKTGKFRIVEGKKGKP
jgi:hypothetical protein